MGFSLTTAFEEPKVPSAFACLVDRSEEPKVTGVPSYLVILSTKYWDEDSKLSYYGHRYYSPGMGRWVSRDPIGESGGINILLFVRNNSVNEFDLLGLDEIIIPTYFPLDYIYNQINLELSRRKEGDHFGEAVAARLWKYIGDPDITYEIILGSECFCKNNELLRFANYKRKVQFYSSNYAISLAQWMKYDTGSKAQQEAWDNVMRDVRTHEDKHIEIFKHFDTGVLDIIGIGLGCSDFEAKQWAIKRFNENLEEEYAWRKADNDKEQNELDKEKFWLPHVL